MTVRVTNEGKMEVMMKPEWVCVCRDPENSATYAMRVPGGVVLRFDEFSSVGHPTSVAMCHIPFVDVVECEDGVLFGSSMEDMAKKMGAMKKTMEVIEDNGGHGSS